MTFFTLFPLTVLIVYSKEKFLIDRIPLRKRLNFDPQEVETADVETTEREVAEIKSTAPASILQLTEKSAQINLSV